MSKRTYQAQQKHAHSLNGANVVKKVSGDHQIEISYLPKTKQKIAQLKNEKQALQSLP